MRPPPTQVLNCLPDARLRFDFLVGMRAQLRAGGLAFVVLPDSCLAHSRTLNRESFVDCLRAVGLPPDPDAQAPDSSKLVYFECVAGLPDADAAARFQKTRHGLRGGPDARAGRRKSRGAEFDVDLGGHLGFGARVPRSFEPTQLSRGKREQHLARDEFLCQLEEEKEKEQAQQAASVRSTAGARGAAGGTGDASARAPGASAGASAGVLAGFVSTGLVPEPQPSTSRVATAEDEMIERAASGLAGRLNFADWRWRAPPPRGGGGEGRGEGGWAFESEGLASGPSIQDLSGWRWAGGAWSFTAPPAEPAGAGAWAGAGGARSGRLGSARLDSTRGVGRLLRWRGAARAGARGAVRSAWHFSCLPSRIHCWWRRLLMRS